MGPNPAINGYVVSDGKDVRAIAGATSAGASFVVRNDAGINSAKDLGGKKFAVGGIIGSTSLAML